MREEGKAGEEGEKRKQETATLMKTYVRPYTPRNEKYTNMNLSCV